MLYMSSTTMLVYIDTGFRNHILQNLVFQFTHTYIENHF